MNIWKPVCFVQFDGRPYTIYGKNGRFISLMDQSYRVVEYDKGEEAAQDFCDEINNLRGFDTKEDCIEFIANAYKHKEAHAG